MIKKHSFFLVLFIILADQTSKFMILKFVDFLPITLTPFFDLVLVWNKGISFGILNADHNPWISYGLVTLITLMIGIITTLLYREKEPHFMTSYSMILGGALGNLIDRIVHGKVVDFLDFYLGDLHWPAFNVADAFIVFGVTTCMWFFYVKPSEPNKN